MLNLLPAALKDKIIVSTLNEKYPDCWIWVGAHIDGYGSIYWQKRTHVVHKVVYELLVEVVPSTLNLDHLCRIRPCCNPQHLEPVTVAENILRGNGAGAKNKLKTHCPKGHLLAGDNLVPSTSKMGFRKCLTCSRERQRLYDASTRRNRHG